MPCSPKVIKQLNTFRPSTTIPWALTISVITSTLLTQLEYLGLDIIVRQIGVSTTFGVLHTQLAQHQHYHAKLWPFRQQETVGCRLNFRRPSQCQHNPCKAPLNPIHRFLCALPYSSLLPFIAAAAAAAARLITTNVRRYRISDSVSVAIDHFRHESVLTSSVLRSRIAGASRRPADRPPLAHIRGPIPVGRDGGSRPAGHAWRELTAKAHRKWGEFGNLYFSCEEEILEVACLTLSTFGEKTCAIEIARRHSSSIYSETGGEQAWRWWWLNARRKWVPTCACASVIRVKKNRRRTKGEVPELVDTRSRARDPHANTQGQLLLSAQAGRGPDTRTRIWICKRGSEFKSVSNKIPSLSNALEDPSDRSSRTRKISGRLRWTLRY